MYFMLGAMMACLITQETLSKKEVRPNVLATQKASGYFVSVSFLVCLFVFVF